MEAIFLSIKAIIPVFLIMTIGYGLRWRGVITEEYARISSKLVFCLFLPAMCFNSIYNNTVGAESYLRLIVFIVLAFSCFAILSFIFVPIFEKNRARIGVNIQGIFRSNSLLMGLPLAINFLGDSEIVATLVATAVILPFQNIYSIAAFSAFKDGVSSLRASIKRILADICKNLLIISIFAGFVLRSFRIQLPEALEFTISGLGSVATTLALFTLGSTFKVQSVKGNGRHILVICLFRLIIVPVIAICAAIKMGFAYSELFAVIVVFATPCGVSGYPLAVTQGADGELAGQYVIFTTVVAVATLFIFLTGLSWLGYL